jgi:hypothetical protein
MSGTPPDDRQQALYEALRAVLRPLADLAIAQGVPYTAAQELLKRTFVDAAREAQPDPTAQRMISRISTATGITRREVTRLCETEPGTDVRPRSLINELFAHWTTAREYRDRRGVPRTLPRTGPEPSFEALAQSLTRDVHPRSLLDELLRLGVATHDPQRDTVTLQRDAFVPRGDAVRMLRFLGDNVGDHLKAAVHNVLTDGKRHFEQAVFADELSAESIEKARALVRQQWQALIDALVPPLEQLVAEDEALNRVRHQRLRIGLYAFNETMSAPAMTAAPTIAVRRTKRKRKDSV